MTWDTAYQIELVVIDVGVNRPRGSGPSVRNSLPFILWYKDIAKIIMPSLPVSAMEKLTKP
jgi:hypothetical protein